MSRVKRFLEFINEDSKNRTPRLDPIIKRKANIPV